MNHNRSDQREAKGWNTGPERRSAQFSWRKGAGAHDLYHDGSCKGHIGLPAMVKVCAVVRKRPACIRELTY